MPEGEPEGETMGQESGSTIKFLDNIDLDAEGDDGLYEEEPEEGAAEAAQDAREADTPLSPSEAVIAQVEDAEAAETPPAEAAETPRARPVPAFNIPMELFTQEEMDYLNEQAAENPVGVQMAVMQRMSERQQQVSLAQSFHVDADAALHPDWHREYGPTARKFLYELSKTNAPLAGHAQGLRVAQLAIMEEESRTEELETVLARHLTMLRGKKAVPAPKPPVAVIPAHERAPAAPSAAPGRRERREMDIVSEVFPALKGLSR